MKSESQIHSFTYSRKILFVIPTLGSGGSERVLINLLRNLDSRKFDLNLAVVVQGGLFRSMVPKAVKVYDLNLKRVRYAAIPLMRIIKKLNPDVILSFMGHLNFLMSVLKSLIPNHIRLIIRENTMVKENVAASGPWWFSPMYRLLYNRADLIICQSDVMKKGLIDNYGINQDRTKTVYNLVDIENIDSNIVDAPNPYPVDVTFRNILAIGRLSREKRFDLLIRKFARFQKIRPDTQLWILGEGSLLSDLQRLTYNLGVSDFVNFMGFQANPYIWMRHADLFVVCSAYEGLPNVLLEALACGCPVVATDCPGGTREIMELTNNVDRLVPVNEFDLKEEFFETMSFLETRTRLKKHFGPTTIIKQYESILNGSTCA
ncbi:MAG: glycosyltransferase [Pseudomonadota bacterium]